MIPNERRKLIFIVLVVTGILVIIVEVLAAYTLNPL